MKPSFGLQVMDAENMKYSEQEKDVSVACNSEVWEDIGQDTMAHNFYVP